MQINQSFYKRYKATAFRGHSQFSYYHDYQIA